ncbi:hypothetical protein, partial [Vibrio parahaemolyticus]|uniref:hypothetical protein n=1 Tax=Vibrio parahaemolyticus TaxID=670 RepID=UPI00235DCD34
TGIATVVDGTVTGVKFGSTTVTATKDGVTSAPATINVTPTIVSLDVRLSFSDLEPNLYSTISVIATYSDGRTEDTNLDAEVTTSFDESVAIITLRKPTDTKYSIYAKPVPTSTEVKLGTITASYKGMVDTIDVSIKHRITYSKANSVCSALGMRMPTIIELQNIFETQTSGVSGNIDMCTNFNWPLLDACGGVMSSYMTSDRSVDGQTERVDMTTGLVSGGAFSSGATAYYHCVP